MAAVVGLGVVGEAALQSFELKNVFPLHGYDKYKDGGTGSLKECCTAPLILLCLPTPYDDSLKTYDKQAIHDTLRKLTDLEYKGIVIIKSTVEPGTTALYSKEFPTLTLCHSPEFLSAKSAFEDFHNQQHIVIGKGPNCTNTQTDILYRFFHTNYPQADISLCTCTEAESMKCFVNTFYAVKVQYFNELYTLCQHMDVQYTHVRDLMLKNQWINPMHTDVPGHDGRLSYGGACLPKDTTALLECMRRAGTPHEVLEGCVSERNRMREETSPSSSSGMNDGGICCDEDTASNQGKLETSAGLQPSDRTHI